MTDAKSKVAQSKKTDFVIDHFGPDITAEHNCLQKAIKLAFSTSESWYYALDLIEIGLYQKQISAAIT